MGTAAWLSPFFGRNIEKGVDPHAALEDNRPVLVMRGFAPAIHQGFQRGVTCIMRRPSGENGAIAQLGERVLCKHEVVGSIPSGSTTFITLTTALRAVKQKWQTGSVTIAKPIKNKSPGK